MKALESLTLRLSAKETAYEILIGSGALEALSGLVKGRRFAVVTDAVVWACQGRALLKALSPHGSITADPGVVSALDARENQWPKAPWPKGMLALSVVPSGEQSKSLECLTGLYSDFIRAGLTRKDLVVAFGGGVVGDLAGYAAATYLRGVDFIQIPTSLLAMVDSSVGGKVAIDVTEGKNLVGAFHQPRAVLVDPSLLDTLPVRQLRDGISEMVKAAMIRDAALLETITEVFRGLPEDGRSPWTTPLSTLPGITPLLRRAISIKKEIVEADEKETGDRKLLNFGHTLGHAAESKGGYSAEVLTHGEGVALGMQWITRISEAKGLTEAGTAALLERVLLNLGFEQAPPLEFDDLRDWVLRDKKKTDTGLEVILIRCPGEGYVYRLMEEEIEAFFTEGAPTPA